MRTATLLAGGATLLVAGEIVTLSTRGSAGRSVETPLWVIEVDGGAPALAAGEVRQ